MKLTQHFFLSEFVASQTAARRGIDNSPPPVVISRLRDVTAPGMEIVRHICRDNVVHVSSGYRCSALNIAIGGVANSAHLSGYAVDFTIPSYGHPAQIARILEAAHARGEIEYDQLIYEYQSWVHISFDPRMRGQVLTYRYGHSGALPGIIE